MAAWCCNQHAQQLTWCMSGVMSKLLNVPVLCSKQQHWLRIHIQWNASHAKNRLHTSSSRILSAEFSKRIPANGRCIAAGICETVQCFNCDSVHQVAGVSLSLR